MTANESLLDLIPLSHLDNGNLVFSWWDNSPLSTMIITTIENIILIVFLYGLLKLLEEYFSQRNEIDKSSLDWDTKQFKGAKNRFNESIIPQLSFIPKLIIAIGLLGMVLGVYLSSMILNTIILSMSLSIVFVVINKSIEFQLKQRLRFIS